ncbi:DHHW family protein [Clostridium botulinum]|nr:DHHW family protein [Clostridium botulinum]
MTFFIIGMFVINIFSKDRGFSESENRVLQSRPSFSFQKLKSGKFTKEYEKYITDQFAFRDFWVGIKSSTDKLLEKKDNNGVYLGKDGYLLEKPEKIDGDNVIDNIDYINQFAKNNPKCKINFLLAPNSVKILEEKLPKYATPEDEENIINKVEGKLNSQNIKFVDVYEELKNHKNEYIYYKTDHHWTTLGAYYAYEKLGYTMGYKPLPISDFNIEKVTQDFYGTLYSKGNYRDVNPDSIEIFKPKKQIDFNINYFDNQKTSSNIYEFNNLQKKDKYSVFLDGNHDLVTIKTIQKNTIDKNKITKITKKKIKKSMRKRKRRLEKDKSTKVKKLLVVKDSYAHSLVPFLTNHYDEIYMVDLRYFNDNVYEYIKKNDIKDILFLYNVLTFTKESTISKLEPQ